MNEARGSRHSCCPAETHPTHAPDHLSPFGGHCRGNPRQAEAWREQIKAALKIPTPLPALEPKTHGSFEAEPGIIVERVTYGTQFGLRVPAILYRPKSPTGKIPALIVVNGHGGDKFSWYALYAGIAYARGGAAVLTYDPMGEGERNINRKSGTRAHDVVYPPDEMGRRLGGAMITDVMQAVSTSPSGPRWTPPGSVRWVIRWGHSSSPSPARSRPA